MPDEPTAADPLELLPDTAQVDRVGELVVGGCRLSEIAARFGTPAYVVDEMALRARVRRFRDALGNRRPRSRVLFATKAFPCVAALALMAQEGLGLDVAGGGELVAALHAGVPAQDLVLHGNAKTDAELRMAVDAGVGLVVIDNTDDIDRLEQIVRRPQHVLLRVLPEVDPHTYDAVATGQRGSKFGMPLDQAERAIARLRDSDRLLLDGLHLHIGSQIMDTGPFGEAIEAIAGLGTFDTYDLGGGLGVRYTYSDRPPSPEEWIEALADAADRLLPSDARILIEPGRSLVARSGLTLYRVTTVKPGDPPLVAVDGGMGDNLEVALYGQRFEGAIVDRPAGDDVVDLVGRHCESGDRLITGARLAQPRVGDVLALAVTGAYCFTMANNYNGALRPPVVFCRDGDARLVVRRETYEDTLARTVRESTSPA